MVERGEWRAIPGGDAVADHGQHAVAKGGGELAQVGPELSVGGVEVGVQGAGLLELEDHQRQAVAVEHHVEAALALGPLDGHLVDDEPLVIGRLGADHPERRALLRP